MVRVSTELGPAPTQRVLVLQDQLRDGQRLELMNWVSQGGTLVVADTSSALARRKVNGSAQFFLSRNSCTIVALDGIGRIEENAVDLLPVESGDQHCFGDDAGAFVINYSVGKGQVVELGGAEPFSNDFIARGDNAALAVALLAPDHGTVTWLSGAPVGGGDKTLWQLVPRGVKLALLQLIIAFVVIVLWRARRLGSPVDEPQLVQVASAELIAATARLWARGSLPSHAAQQLRTALRVDLARRHGITVELAPEAAAGALQDLIGIERDPAYRALVDPVDSNEELQALHFCLTAIRAQLEPNYTELVTREGER